MKKATRVLTLPIEFIFWALSLVSEAIAVYLFFFSSFYELYTVVGPVAFHVLACLTFGFGVRLSAQNMLNTTNWVIVSMILAFFFPPYGILGGSIIFWTRKAFRKDTRNVYNDYEDYITSQMTEQKYWASDTISEQIMDEMDVQPIVDILSETDASFKRGAISLTEQLGKKEAVKLLSLAQQDKNREINYLATIELSRLESDLINTILLAKKQVQDQPDSDESHLVLANAYSDYYESGLIKEQVQQHYLEKAIEAYQKSLSINEQQPEVLKFLGTYHIRQHEYSSAQTTFDKLIEIDKQNPYGYLGLAEVYYNMKKLVEMKDILLKGKKACPDIKDEHAQEQFSFFLEDHSNSSDETDTA